jgi:preprotein translocase subunit SecA
MDGEHLREIIDEMRQETIDGLVDTHIPETAYAEQWDAKGLAENVQETLNLDLPIEEWAKEEGIAEDNIRERLTEAANAAINEKMERFGPEIAKYVEKSVVLQTIDGLWREHLVNLDHLRSVVGFRGYAQRDPLNEYKSEAFELFQTMLTNLRKTVTSQLSRVEVVRQAAEAPPPELPRMFGEHIDGTTGENDFGEVFDDEPNFVPAEQRDPSNPATWGKIGRNEACPCNSGKKFKHCHGVFA